MSSLEIIINNILLSIILTVLFLVAAYFGLREYYIIPKIRRSIESWDSVEVTVVDRIQSPEDPPAFNYRVKYWYFGEDYSVIIYNKLHINTSGVVIGDRFLAKIDPDDHQSVVIVEHLARHEKYCF